MRYQILILAFVLMAGCASQGRQSGSDAVLVDIRAKLGLGRCDAQLVEEVRALARPGLEQEAAYACLQQGQVLMVEQLLSDYQSRHGNPPNVDYSVYLLALVDYVRFELAEGDPNSRLGAGRKAHEQLVAFVRSYPDSAYRQEVVPRLEALHEGMARAEYHIALADIEGGKRELGVSRLRYVLQHYPRSEAAIDARRWLDLHQEP